MKAKSARKIADILVVDDKPANLRLLSQTLAEKGYGVRTVTSGMRALESARSSPPDLILLDIRMPGMDGYEVCAQLKRDARTAHIPILFISALDHVEDKVQAFTAGGLDYITKPFQIEEVLARTETHLSLHRLQSSLEEINERMQRELTLAGKVQSSFLPGSLPGLPGWEFAASLRSARETSGDFYDVIRLANGCLGLLVADVVDKGVPAALLMALSWSLLWSYAAQHPDSPEQVLVEVNRRLLMHLGGNQFLTCFYGVLNPENGQLKYVNAGHPGPLLIQREVGRIDALANTGPPLGVLEDAAWQQGEALLESGSLLLLYTDGLTDACDEQGTFYGIERLMQVVRHQHGSAAQAVHDALLMDIDSFVVDVPQFDDSAVIVVRRV
jgi:sigma-B regulation protein RsbU (phosphoserine phosphatase)